MKTPPVLRSEYIMHHINQCYRVNLEALDFLPIGEGSWCFRGRGDTDLFIRLVPDAFAKQTLAVPSLLEARGLPALRTLAAKSGALSTQIDDYHVIVTPFTSGISLMKGTFAPNEVARFRRAIGMHVAHMHRMDAPCLAALNLPTEDFAKFQNECINLLQIVDRQHDDPLNADLARFLSERRKAVAQLIVVTQQLSQKLRTQELDYVLCHGDIHEDNVLISEAGELVIIDWDTVILAPKERDLTFFQGDGKADYLGGYFGEDADHVVNQAVIDYYVFEWALQEIANYSGRILGNEHFDLAGRVDAWAQFQRLFEPGQDVDWAFDLMRADRYAQLEC